MVVWLLKLEDGQVRLQSRLEQEEEAKAALMSRIQRLTKLILVSTKASQSPKFPQRAGLRRRHSFGEEEVFCTFPISFFPSSGVMSGWLLLNICHFMIRCSFHSMWQLAYLPHRRRDIVLDDDNMDMYVSLDGTAEIDIVDDKLREEKRTKKTGLLSWLKPRVCYFYS